MVLESKQKSAAPPTTDGLAGITAADSEISMVDGTNGVLVYRGYSIRDLADNSTFEETAFLLWNGRLPTRTELETFHGAVAAQRALPQPVLDMLRSVAKTSTPMHALRTAVSMLGASDPDADTDSDDGRRRIATRLLATFPTIVAAHWRLSQGQEPVAPTGEGSVAKEFLRMLFGQEPTDEAARILDVALILHADHEFNASTFSARVTTSTLSDVYSAITSAIGTLKGPLHGGANREVMKALQSIKDGVEGVEPFVKDKLARKKKIMGFGHRVYKTMDPRAIVLRDLSKRIGQDKGDSKWYDMSAKMEEVVMAEKGLNPNVDFYAASLYHVMGFPLAVFPSLFAISRISGWLAHVLEQYADNKLIRPVANYVGPRDLTYTPVGERGD